MQTLTRRGVLTAGTLAAALAPRKPRAALPGSGDPAGLPGLRLLRPPQPPPAIRFADAAGAFHTLPAYRGKGVVLNLWATWCPPCVRELPSLAAMARRLAPAGIVVLPLSADLGGTAVVQRYFQAHGITGLPVLLDPDGSAMHALGARGVPTTYLIDPAGKEVGWVEGAQDWSAPASLARVKALIGG
jgi:thiol-disulfide isomerase/thioredoxin